ncbi:alpha/beta hydrolase [Alcanivorax marinus]|uniref:Alpha/beta hydrolase n=1 Tax=Alloalcanivorax marinus TaxID=1177169 RepID=A0A9Q3UPF8_9GAMM|nr:alpha/beta fold hydrolase [Alloalcanivorax marinus]MCC4309980.1 alpha/beta hydrolase [Alloalcanivorax marinus]
MASVTPIQFQSAGVFCRGDLYLPDATGPVPILVMAHGLGGTRDMRLPAFAERFQAEGYACLLFDYRHFGDSEGEPRQLLDIKKQLQDWKAAVAHARTLEQADPERVILWGTSFSGGHVLATATDDPGLAAVIAQCPFTDGLASTLATEPLVSAKLTARALRDRLGALIGAEPVMVAVAGRPGETALMTAPDAWDGYLNLAPAGAQVRNEVPARFALDIIRYYPGRKAAAIQAPVLYCVCDNDTVAPARQTLRHASRTPRHEIRRYQAGHFEIYLGEAFEQVVADQIRFLQKHCPPGSP